jgi:hypothetical protein
MMESPMRELIRRHRLVRNAAMVAVMVSPALLAACAQPPPPPPPVQVAPPPAPIPPARG